MSMFTFVYLYNTELLKNENYATAYLDNVTIETSKLY